MFDSLYACCDCQILSCGFCSTYLQPQ